MYFTLIIKHLKEIEGAAPRAVVAYSELLRNDGSDFPSWRYPGGTVCKCDTLSH